MIHPPPAPVNLLIGREPFLREAWITRLRQQLDIGPFDEHTFHAPQVDIAEVIAAAQSAPLAADHRLILLRDAELLPSQTLTPLVVYAHHPRASTCLVLLVHGQRPAHALWEELSALAEVIACDAPQGPMLVQWMSDRAAALGKHIQPDAAALLEEQWGANLLALANAVEQAACYVGTRREIGERDIAALGGRHPQATVFQWVDVIVNRDAQAALRFLTVQQQEGKTAAQLIGMLTWQFDRLLRAKRLQHTGVSESQALASAGVKPYWRGVFLRQLAGYTLPQLQQALETILATDVASKRGQTTPDVALVLLVVRLCGVGAGEGVTSATQRTAA